MRASKSGIGGRADVLLLSVFVGIVTFAGACGSGRERVPTIALPTFEGRLGPVSTNVDPNPARSTAVLKAVRITEEAGFDRIVFEFGDQLPAAEVEYQQRAIGCGTGEPIPVRGSPVLVVRFDGAVAHDDQGRLSVASTQFAGPGKAVQEVKLACDFEAELTWAMGIGGQRPFRVETLAEPPRMVVDVGW